MKVLFILKTGATIEWPIPDELHEGFKFDIFCGNIRIATYFQCPNMHIKYEDMQGMLFTSAEAPAPELRGTLQ